MNSRQHIVTTAARKRARGFSLVEVLTVVAIIAIMMSLMAPAISGFSSTAGRRGAVNLVMNTIDQARVAALEQGREVQVIFWRREFPEKDAIMIRRKNDSGQWDALTRWQSLPSGVLLHKPEKGSSHVFHTSPGDKVNTTDLPGNPQLTSLGLIEFTPRGTIITPRGSDDPMVILTEGTRETESIISQNKQQNGGFEIISVARYTGRPNLEISEIPQG
jgi:prepilin-type N-terminal cleavage/methylation domain-containing protein